MKYSAFREIMENNIDHYYTISYRDNKPMDGIYLRCYADGKCKVPYHHDLINTG